MKNTEIYNRITEEIVSIMEKGQIPWKKTWNGTADAPRNGVSQKPYNGTNCYLLLLPYSSREYFTFNQIKELGGSINKGEKGHYITYWTFITPKDTPEGEEVKPIPFLKHYVVWNREQVSGLPEPKDIPTRTVSPIEAGEQIVQGYKDAPMIKFGGDKAYYSPALDYIQVPKRDDFTGSNEYYSTLFHEMTHSTGNEKRLNRSIQNRFGDTEYSKEELVAELGAAFLCGIAGIDNNSTKKNTAAYIQSWIKVLKNDTKFFFDASRLAGKAVQYITEGKA